MADRRAWRRGILSAPTLPRIGLVAVAKRMGGLGVAEYLVVHDISMLTATCHSAMSLRVEAG
jgi:hypothetical protein